MRTIGAAVIIRLFPHRATIVSHARRYLTRLLAALAAVTGTSRHNQNAIHRALVVAPHPDDEVLGCGGTIATKAALGAPVRVVVMTDGGASHADHIGVEELVRTRKKEAVEAAAILGLGSEDYQFLDFPDHQLRLHRDKAVGDLEAVLLDFEPNEIYVPHRRDRLDDHVATNEIVRQALRAYPRRVFVLEYPVWLWNTWPWTNGDAHGNRTGAVRAALTDACYLTFACRERIDIGDVLERKNRALRAYKSQIERPDGKANWPVLGDVSDGEFLECFQSPVERFQRWVHDP